MKKFVLVLLAVPTLVWSQEEPVSVKDLLAPIPQMSTTKLKKPASSPVVKGASYLFTYEAEDDNWYQIEVVATGRSAKFCNGMQYEVVAPGFREWALPKELKRIYGKK